ncbi:putative toxin-antitoxin system toxin component, PIN family [Oleiagrimonas sp. C23AA]|uniref:putative toxin-antitoxin system toxin component, PIN family n=1 Tax=Oleiagrimonas sp. C23AA TaxID=2719047 RepID=UPI0014239699|nr:putative toxin-antitoxin system toxin component, PIN family [Oleiagrimonas sp. C23AA]NII09594.1 putative toxin-antitoxin system toxin component, PIN family [Oleiagrimonas sp. C23AA]
MTEPPRLVLDTNICLDLFVYRDAASQPIMRALEQGRFQAVTSQACREEWLRVLHYPQFRIDEAQRVEVTAAFDRWIACLPVEVAEAPLEVDLPRCKDSDDQKFLEAAQRAGAVALVSKDRAVLKLARKHRKLGLFAIVSPSGWCQMFEAPAA